MAFQSTSKNFILHHLFNSSEWQYKKFIEFINSTSEPFKTQLSYFVYPLFVHFYLQFVANGKVDYARRFLEKHRSQFEISESCKHHVDELSRILTVQELKSHPLFKMFWERRVIVELSEKCAEYLLIYLQDMKCATVLYLLHSHFSLEYNGTENDQIPEEVEEPLLRPLHHRPEARQPSADPTSLQEASYNVRNGPPCLPALCSYTLSVKENSLNTLCISSQSAYIAGGFEESDIRVWYIPEGVSCSAFTQETDICKSQTKHLLGHSGPIYGMAFTHDGQHLFSCSEDTTVRVWDMKNFENMTVYSGHVYPIWDIDLSPLSLYFATASKDRTARLWVTDRMYPLRMYIGHTSDVDHVKFHPNCKYLATSSSDQTICLWSVHNGNRVQQFKGHTGYVNCLAFSPNGLYLLSAGEDKLITIWDIRSGKMLNELHGHTDTVCSLSFNNSNTLLASTGRDNTVKLWDAQKAYSCASISLHQNGIDQDNSQELLSSFSTESSLREVSFINMGLLMSFGVS